MRINLRMRKRRLPEKFMSPTVIIKSIKEFRIQFLRRRRNRRRTFKVNVLSTEL